MAGCLVAAVVLTTCAAGDGASEEASAPRFSAPIARPDSAAATSAGETEATGDELSFCSKLSLAEIEAAFGNEVSFGSRPSRDESNFCVYANEDATGLSTFQFAARRDMEEYRMAREQHEGAGGPIEPIEGIGVEAHLFDGSQLEIRLNETEAITLVVGVMVFGAEPPLDEAEKRSGLIELGRKLIARL